MGKPGLVRIANRGSFPRWRLESVGSSSKRDKLEDDTQGGWFGSGTKIAPVAALALGMEVWVASTDAEGAYLVTYVVEPRVREGEDDSRVVRVYHGTDAVVRRDVTDFSPGAFMNWSKPIGDDDKKEFRVWREYLRNAKDADPASPIITHAHEAAPVIRGMTAAYLTRTSEYEEIMRTPERYFKYLSKDKAFFLVPGIGQFWPKSQPGVTRLFSLGTLAYCNDCTRTNWSTLYDYSFDEKSLMSEERTFENLTRVQLELARMLCQVPSVQLAKALLEAMLSGKAELERLSLGQVTSKWPIPTKDRWKAAWRAIHGDAAVIATGNWFDQHARISFRKEPVNVTSHGLRSFLKICGVEESSDVVPASDRLGYRVIVPTRQEQAVLDEARAILIGRHPEMRAVPVRVYEPLDQATAQAARGFCLPPAPPFKEVYLRRDELSDIRKALGTLNHEYRHVRTGALDGTPEFMDRADEDEVDLLLELRRREEASWHLEWEDLKTDPDAKPAPAPSEPPPKLPPIPKPPKKT